MLVCRSRAQRFFEMHSSYTGEILFKKLVGQGFDGGGSLDASRSTVRRIVFKTAALGGIVRGSNDYAIRKSSGTVAVVSQYGVRNGGGGSIFPVRGQHDFNPVCGQHFKCACIGRFGKRMCVNA